MKSSSEISIYYQLPGFPTLRGCLTQTTFALPPLLITIICGDSANTLPQGITETQTLLKLTQDVQDYKPSRHGVAFCLSNPTFSNTTKARRVPSGVIPVCLFLNVTSYRANRCEKKKEAKQKTQAAILGTRSRALWPSPHPCTPMEIPYKGDDHRIFFVHRQIFIKFPQPEASILMKCKGLLIAVY